MEQVCEPQPQQEPAHRTTRPRALLVIPGAEGASSYIFSKRQAAMLAVVGADVRTFFVKSRTSPRLIVAEFLRLRKTVAEFRPDVIHAQYGTMNGFLAAMAGSVPFIITFRGSDLNPVRTFGRARILLGHLLSNLAALNAEVVICVSEGLQNRLWWNRKRARVIVGGVDLDLFRPIEKPEARGRLGWAMESPIVLFNAGRHPGVKRLDLAEASVMAAREVRPEIEMVTLRGEVDPDLMPLYYSGADCLLVTSDWEGSPTVIKEALACNLPVVSVPVGDAVERLRGVEPSFIANRDPRELAAALLSVLATQRRANGRPAVGALSERTEAERICCIYESVMQKKRQ